MILRHLVAMVILVSLSGCASYFLRKDCNKTNWFSHGQKVAMKGKRLDSDDFVKSCQKVEADVNWAQLDSGFKSGMSDYCKPQSAYGVGKRGEQYNYDMCSSSGGGKLRAAHDKGLTAYCKPDNAYRVGAQGKIYGNVCVEKDEESFLKRYHAGRKVFLTTQIENKENEIKALDRKILEGERERKDLRYRLSRVRAPRARGIRRASAKKEELSPAEKEAERRRESLSNDIRRVDRQIKASRSKQDALRKEIGVLKTERNSLI